MSLRRQNNYGKSVGIQGSQRNQNLIKKVVDIVLDSNHQGYNTVEDIGTIYFIDVGFNQDYTDSNALPKAKPLSRNNMTYPTIGELVQIVEGPSNDIYNDLGGDISSKTLYYTAAINVHNNTASNSLPLEKDTKKINPKREPNVKIFNFQKEFSSQSRETARKQLDNYLINLGYTSGISDPRAPKYNLFQKADQNYVFRLEDSEDNEQKSVKLGNYFKENPELRPLIPSEGDSIMEGKNGQRIRFTTTGPTGTNAISNNVTDVPDDGNPSIGDKAMVLSLGNGSQENVTKDAASIYMLENQSIPIDATSTNVDSLNSNYEPSIKPLEEISKKPALKIPSSLPNSELQIAGGIEFDFSSINEPASLTSITSSLPEEDPVFAALDEAQNEGLLLYSSSTYSIDEGEDVRADQGSDEGAIVNPAVGSIIFNDADYINTPKDSLYTATGRGLGFRGITLATVIKSNTAVKEGIQNFPGVDANEGSNYTAAVIMYNLDRLVAYCIDPLLDRYPNLIISSGLRVRKLNVAIGGAINSEHRLGRAIDLQVPGVLTYEIFNYIVNNNIPYNQLIWEFPERGNRSWIHISYHDGNNKFNRTIASKNPSLKKALENNYNGINFNGGTYAQNIEITNVPDHRTLT